MEPLSLSSEHFDAGRIPSAGSTDAEPARVFLQDRIRLWTFWVFALSFGFYLVMIGTWFLAGDAAPPLAAMLLQRGHVDHFLASVTFGGVWVMTRRGVWSMRTLRGLELGALFAGCGLFALMSMSDAAEWGASFEGGIGLFSGLLACANTVMARAITIPSTPGRTFVVSIAAMVPMAAASTAVSTDPVLVINVATWCAVSIAIATIGSRIIFGLRTEAARARKLGQYTLEEKIGAGGMGVVYRASHAMLRRPTAIKLLPADRAGESSVARFEREVQITAQLSHPNTVAIYDYGRTPEGIFYYAMEYLVGFNLEELVRTDGPQPPGRVLKILDQVCGALSEAHGRGLVHRDIKPANIILTERGGEPDVAKVVDFGLVKPLEPESSLAGRSIAGVLTGTPHYMSPESMTMPESADPRSDLYALGAVGYFLLTAKSVFEGNTIVEVLGHHLHTEPVPPSKRLGTAIPADLEALVLECLRKKPEDRPASARAMRDALRRCANVTPWTTERATAWWQEHRATPRPASESSTGVAPTGGTVTVDLEDRLTVAVDTEAVTASK